MDFLCYCSTFKSSKCFNRSRPGSRSKPTIRGIHINNKKYSQIKRVYFPSHYLFSSAGKEENGNQKSQRPGSLSFFLFFIQGCTKVLIRQKRKVVQKKAARKVRICMYFQFSKNENYSKQSKL